MPRTRKKRLPFRQWKTVEDVASLTVSNKIIGKGTLGTVYSGKVRFKDGSRQRIAIKKFGVRLTDAKAQAYQEVIKKLGEAGVPMPKMTMVKMPTGEWVQISELFVKKGKTKLREDWIYPLKEKIERESMMKLAEIFAKTVNAGYAPAIDFVMYITKTTPLKEARFPIPIDLDALLFLRRSPVEFKVSCAVNDLGRKLSFRRKVSKKEEREVFQKFLETLKPGYRAIARNLIKELLK